MRHSARRFMMSWSWPRSSSKTSCKALLEPRHAPICGIADFRPQRSSRSALAMRQSRAHNALKEFLAEKGVLARADRGVRPSSNGEGIAALTPFSRSRHVPDRGFAAWRSLLAGALLGGRLAKYLNSPETELSTRGGFLHVIVGARAQASRKLEKPAKSIIAVEGYMDDRACAGGYPYQVVAPLGTADGKNSLNFWRSALNLFCASMAMVRGRAVASRRRSGLPVCSSAKSPRFALLPAGAGPGRSRRGRPSRISCGPVTPDRWSIWCGRGNDGRCVRYAGTPRRTG